MTRRTLYTAWLALATWGLGAVAQDPWAPPAEGDISQVQIEVWISETGEQGLRDIGANLYYHRFVRGQEESGSVERVVTNVFDPRDPKFSVTVPTPSTPNNSPVFEGVTPPPDGDVLRPDRVDNRIDNGVQTQSGAGITFDIIDAGRGTINGVFRAIEQTSDVDLISKPEVLVSNGQPALIHAGGEVPVQDIAYNNKGDAQLNVKWEKIGVEMDLVPTILADNLVELNLVKMEVRDILRIDNIRGVDLPVFSTRKQSGPVVVTSGETVVIGGLTSRVDRRSESRVPIVGDLPFIGVPFRGRQTESSISTLLIFLSPTIVNLRDLKEESINALNFWQRNEWQYRERIEREVQVLQDE